MSAEIKKDGEFNPACVRNLYEDLQMHNQALRSFGELLRSSNLKEFSNEGEGLNVVKTDLDREMLRHGLFQIIELYIDRQEKIVAKYVDQYNNSDESMVLSATQTICTFDESVWTPEGAAERLRESIKDLEVVIGRGGELAGDAKELKEVCHQHLRSTMKTESVPPAGACAVNQT